MVLLKNSLVLFTVCLWISTSEAIRSDCNSRPIDYFYFQMDVLFENSSQQWADRIDSLPTGASFKPILDAANELRSSATNIMDTITGCVSTYPKTKPPAASPETTKAPKLAKEAKSSKAPKLAKEAKSSKAPKLAKEAKSSKTPKLVKEGKAQKEEKSAKTKSSKAPKRILDEEELDVPEAILGAIFLFTDNSYFFNSYNTLGGTAWTFRSHEGGFEAIPVRDIDLVPGAFDDIVCGYKSLVSTLVLIHQQLTDEPNTALEYVALVEIYSTEYYGASSTVSYCKN